MTAPELVTKRLVLRRWRRSDRDPFAEMNADPEVMRHFPATLDRAGSDGLAERADAALAAGPFGLWAVEVVGGPPFVGFVGLAVPGWDPPFGPCVEIGWRLARPHWGRGYAGEAAREALRHGFDTVGLDEIVSFTSTTNEASQAVMRRIGMHRDPGDDFDHPTIADDSPLRRHVLYRLTADEWRTGATP